MDVNLEKSRMELSTSITTMFIMAMIASFVVAGGVLYLKYLDERDKKDVSLGKKK